MDYWQEEAKRQLEEDLSRLLDELVTQYENEGMVNKKKVKEVLKTKRELNRVRDGGEPVMGDYIHDDGKAEDEPIKDVKEIEQIAKELDMDEPTEETEKIKEMVEKISQAENNKEKEEEKKVEESVEKTEKAIEEQEEKKETAEEEKQEEQQENAESNIPKTPLSSEEVKNKQEKVSERLKRLADAHAECKKVSTLIFAREGKDQISKQVKNLGDNIQESAKTYGKKAEELAKEQTEIKDAKTHNKTVLKKYKEELEKVEEKYENEFIELEKIGEACDTTITECIAKRAKLKADKERIINDRYGEIIGEIYDALKDSETILAAQLVKEYDEKVSADEELSTVLRDLRITKEKEELAGDTIDNVIKQEEELEVKRKEELKSLEVAKNEQLVEVKKQNIFKRILGAILNRLGGKKKFEQNVIEPIDQEIEDQAEKEVEEKTNEGVEEVQKEGTLQKIRAKAEQMKKGIMDRVNVIIEWGKAKKASIIKSLDESIEKKEKERDALKLKYEMQKNGNTEAPTQAGDTEGQENKDNSKSESDLDKIKLEDELKAVAEQQQEER